MPNLTIMKRISQFLLCIMFVLPVSASAQKMRTDPELNYAAVEWKGGICFEQQTGVPVSGQLVDRFPNGEVRISSHFHGGKLHGPTRHYFENGQLQSLRQYEQGILTGEVAAYYQNGQLAFRGTITKSYQDQEYLLVNATRGIQTPEGYQQQKRKRMWVRVDSQSIGLQNERYFSSSK